MEHTQLDRTPSGHWELFLQEETIEMLKRKVEQSQNNTMIINKTDSGNIAIDIATHCSNQKKLSFLKRTPSGQTVMKIRKSILNLDKPQEQREEVKVIEKSQFKKSILKSSQPKRKLPDDINKSILKRHVEQLKMDFSLSSDLISNEREKEEISSTDSSDHKDLSYLKVQSSDSSLRNHEVSVRTTKSGNFELLADEEFDHVSSLKYYLGDRKKRSVLLSRTVPGYYEVRLKKGKKVAKKNASLIQTRSGHIKIHVKASEFHSLSKSINIFLPTTRSKASSKRHHSGSGIVKKKSKVSTKSPKTLQTNYDLALTRYIVVRLFYKMECIAEFSAILKKITGGIKAVVLKRNAKYSLLDYLVKHNRLKISPTPVFMSESGIITIYLDKNPRNQRPNANLKVTLSKKNFYIVDEVEPKEIEMEPRDRSSKQVTKKVTISVDSTGEEDGLRLIRHKKLPSKRLFSEGCDTSESEYLQNIFDDIYRRSSSEMIREFSDNDTTFHSASSSRLLTSPDLNNIGSDPEVIIFKDKNYSIWTKPKEKDGAAEHLKIIEAYDKANETEKNNLEDFIDPKPSKDSTAKKYDNNLKNHRKIADHSEATRGQSSDNNMSSIKTFSSMMDDANTTYLSDLGNTLLPGETNFCQLIVDEDRDRKQDCKVVKDKIEPRIELHASKNVKEKLGKVSSLGQTLRRHSYTKDQYKKDEFTNVVSINETTSLRTLKSKDLSSLKYLPLQLPLFLKDNAKQYYPKIE